jgi:hypothetical protein
MTDARYALVGRDVGDVATPGDIGVVGVEQAPQQVRGGWGAGIRLGQAAPTAGAVANDAVATHEPLDSLAIHRPAAPTQLGMHPRRPVGAIRLLVDAADLGDQLGLLVVAWR